MIANALAQLQPFRRRGAEVIVVDGGSDDGTAEAAVGRADRVIVAPRGRALQMNAGAQAASGDILLFLHVDSRLPADADGLIRDGLLRTGSCWGRFDIRIESTHPLVRLIGWFMNRRSRLTGIATGDQGIFVRRAAFVACGGYPPIALMEDIALSRTLKKLGRPLCLRECIVTSGRRWERHGAWRVMIMMWRLRLAYFAGADPARLAAIYERKA